MDYDDENAAAAAYVGICKPRTAKVRQVAKASRIPEITAQEANEWESRFDRKSWNAGGEEIPGVPAREEAIV